MEFRTEAVFDALKSPLSLVEDAEKRQAFERYVEAARFPLERAVFDLLSELVAAVDARVSAHYSLRLAYQPGALQLHVEERPQAQREHAEPDESEWATIDGDTEKITIRIPAELKDLAMQAAAGAGLSANSWFVRALGRSIRAGAEGERFRPPMPPEPPLPPEPPWAGERHRSRMEQREERRQRREERREERHGKRLEGWFGGE